MKSKLYISNLIIALLLLAQINLPTFIHICFVNKTVSVLSSCDMHDPVQKKKSCCAQHQESTSATSAAFGVSSHCEIIFAKEHSTDVTITPLFTHALALNIINSLASINQPIVSHANSSALLLPGDSPPESPPLFLLDSNLRI